MIKLFLRNYVLFVLIVLGVIAAVYFFSLTLNQYFENANGDLISKNVFTLTAQKLESMPQAEWPAYLQKLQPAEGNALSLVKLSNLPADFKDRQNLLQGKIVANYDSADGYTPAYTFYRIPNTDEVLKLGVFQPEVAEYAYNTAWIRTMINQTLIGASPAEWPQILTNMSPNFKNAPLVLRSFQSLDPEAQAHLLKWGVLFNESQNGFVETISFLSPDPKQVITVGPLKDPGRFQIYLWAGMALLILFIIVWIWTFPFYRNLSKLQSMTEAYGCGHFDYTIKVPKKLALYPLYQNLSRMGQQIKQLISSHKELTNAVSHEIRTPLTRIRFATEMLEKEGVQSTYLKRINHDVEELDHLVNELLTYARFDRADPALQFKTTALAPFITELFEMLQTHYPDKTWQLNLQIPKTSKLSFDAYFLKRALENILLNAYRYGKSKIIFTVKAVASNYLFSIEEDGPGIPIEARETVFEPFKRLESSRNKESGGHGLGLAISKKIIEAHHGQIELGDSQLGGAAFTISLPRGRI